MKKVILFGATGHLGFQIALELQRQGFWVRAAVRDITKVEKLKSVVHECVAVDFLNPKSVENAFNGVDALISALGKSVSPNDGSKPSFEAIDFGINTLLIDIAKAKNIKKIVYISAFDAEKHPELAYFNTHFRVEQHLINSGVDFSIIKPVAIMSSFQDLVSMANKGQLSTIGSGQSRTNPIAEHDLAAVCVDSILQKNATIEVGGKTTYTRGEINEIIQKHSAPNKKVYKMPLFILKIMLPIIKIINKNMYDKFAFFAAVTQKDCIAPQIGNTNLEMYLDKIKVSEA